MIQVSGEVVFCIRTEQHMLTKPFYLPPRTDELPLVNKSKLTTRRSYTGEWRSCIM